MSYSISEDSLADLPAYWTDSQSKLNWSSVFVLPAWMRAWQEVFGAGRETFIRTVRDGETVIGIAPLMVNENTAGFIGDPSVCDYQDFVIAPGREKDFCNALLDDLKRQNILKLDLMHVRPDSTVVKVLVPLAGERRYEVRSQPDAISYEMDLPPTFDAYLEGLTTKQRHEVRRKLRRMSEAGTIEYRFVTEGPALSGALDAFFKMFVESRQDKASFLTEPMKHFFRVLAAALAGIGLLRLGVLELDTRPVAEIMCFDYNNCIYLYNSGYDPGYTALSAGLLSKVLAIKDSIEKSKSRFDFLKGAEIYKNHLGGREVPLYRCQVAIK